MKWKIRTIKYFGMQVVQHHIDVKAISDINIKIPELNLHDNDLNSLGYLFTFNASFISCHIVNYVDIMLLTNMQQEVIYVYYSFWPSLI